MSEVTAQLDLPLGVDAPTAARRVVTALLYGWGFHDDTWLRSTAVVVSELITNAVLHGGGSLCLSLQALDGRVVLTVADGSSVVPRRRDPTDAGGRGLTLIEALSAGWGVRNERGGKQVWVELEPYRGWSGPTNGYGRPHLA